MSSERSAVPLARAGETIAETGGPSLLELTPAALAAAHAYLANEGLPVDTACLRVGVVPGGCTGFRYSLTVTETVAPDDLVLRFADLRVLIDPFSASYLNGVTIDFTHSLQGSGFVFRNPNATARCGCGSSFSA